MSIVLSLLMVGNLGCFAGTATIAANDVAVATSSPTSAPQRGKKNSRRSPRKAVPSPAKPMPPLDDLPLGAQDLLLNGPSSSPAGEDTSGAAPSGTSDGNGEGRETEAVSSAEEAWQRAVEEARYELREAEEEKQRQDNADSPPPPGQDAEYRLFKAQANLRRLLEEGRAKGYRERSGAKQP